MNLANKFNIPIISFIDTPGAYPGVGAEERGQAEAIALGLSRAILLFDEEARPELKSERLLKRDSRVVERKKPGFRKARKKEQYSKR